MAKKKKETEDINQNKKEINEKEETQEKEENKINEEDYIDHDKPEEEVLEDEESEDNKTELEEINNKLLRLQADFLNYKNRTEKEKFKYYNDAIEDIVSDMLPILDNFERALENLNSDKNLSKGVEMILNQFINLLKKYGVNEIEALGKKFDPNLHHGVLTEESEEQEEGTVIEVFQKGYKLKDKVIRPSMVKISK